MKKLFSSLVLLASVSSFAGGHDPKVILPLLKESKISLLEGIDLAEKTSGVVTSAKFETNDEGKLVLSIYTIPEGLGVEPEKASLTELEADPMASQVEFHSKIFQDKEHIARSSVHMTLMQLSPRTLKQIVQRALRRVPGTAMDIRNPLMRNKRPVADVIIGADDGDVYTVTVDLLSGKVRAKELK
jgi:uncharacterized membrane protein YkoI